MLWWTLQQLRSQNSETRKQAAEKLGLARETRAIEQLVITLIDVDKEVRYSASVALERIRGIVDWEKSDAARKAIPALVTGLEANDLNVRLTAADTLRGIGDDRALEALVAALDDREPIMRSAAAQALQSLGWVSNDDRLQAIYLISLENWDEVVKMGAVAVEPLLAELTDNAPIIRAGYNRTSVARLSNSDAAGWERAAAESYLSSTVKVSRREKVAKALGEIGDSRAVAPLINLLEDISDWVCRSAAKALGKIGDVRAVEPLIRLLEDQDFNIRDSAAYALADLGAPAVEPLVAALKDSHENVRVGATVALGRIRGAFTVERLIAMLNDKEGNVRYVAAKALCETGDARAIAPLVTVVNKYDSNVQELAMEALMRIGGPHALEAIIGEVNDRKWRVWALERMTPSVKSLLSMIRDKGWEVWCEAKEVIYQRLDADAMEILITALGDNNSDVRRVAAEALGKIKDARAVKSLIASLEDPDELVRQSVAQALGEIGDARAIAPLIKAVNDSKGNASETAEGVVAKIIGVAGTVEMLTDMLNADSKSMRELGVRLLGAIGDTQAINLLTISLGDSDFDVRGMAAMQLKHLKWEPADDAQRAMYAVARRDWYGEVVGLGAAAVEALLVALKDENNDVRWSAATALAQVGDVRAVESLLVALKDNDDAVRRMAAIALGQIRDISAVDPLIVALKDNIGDVRVAAANALGQIGDTRAIEPLKVALGDVFSKVQSAADRALKNIG